MKRFLWLTLSCLLLSACMPILSADTEFSLQPDEAWEMRTRLLLPAEGVLMYGSAVQDTLNEQVGQLQSLGLQAEWMQDEPDDNGNLPVNLIVHGQGYETFNEELFGSQVLSRDESTTPPQIHFSLDTSSVFSEANQSSITLRGGKVISSNGVQENRTTVRWTNPTGRLDAVLEEPSVINWLPYGLVLSGVVLTGAGLLGLTGFFNRQQPTGAYTVNPASSAPAPSEQAAALTYITPTSPTYTPSSPPPLTNQPTKKFCSTCGTEVPMAASFCPQCGGRV